MVDSGAGDWVGDGSLETKAVDMGSGTGLSVEASNLIRKIIILQPHTNNH